MAEIQWTRDKREIALIHEICLLIEEKDWNPYGDDLLACQMDLDATHSNGMPLDLERLREWGQGEGSFDFTHDIIGIYRFLDRSTGRLEGCFLPRCARKGAA